MLQDVAAERGVGEQWSVVHFVHAPSSKQSKTHSDTQNLKGVMVGFYKNPGVVIMKRVLSFLLPIAAVTALLFPVMLQAASLEPIDSAGVQVQQQQQNGIAYLAGGIGEDEAKAIQQTGGYNLHMTFAVGAQDEYTADVDVMIEKSPGQTLLALNQTGPLVYVQLPPGKYTVVATRKGETRRDVTDVGAGVPCNLVFHWNDAG